MTKQEYKELANILFPRATKTVEDMFQRYPERGVPAVRFAPSPTGYLHIGNLMTCNIVSRVAKALGGKYFLRIEDTDQKREVKGAVEYLIGALKNFDITFDEGFDGRKDFGDYGPYVQSKRTEIYHIFAKRMVELGRAYPCFCSNADLDKLREQQETQKIKTGYYGEYALCKNLSLAEIKKKLNGGEKWVLRCDMGDMAEKRIEWIDLIKGKMSLPAEINNPVIIKSDGIPPYNFAHVVDDTLMRVSHVTRGDEWLVSTAEHIQLFEALGLKPPHYAHLPALCVDDNGSKRKISKRKDKAALVQNFLDDGYPKEAIIEYLLTLSNTNFEMWRIQNPTCPLAEFHAAIEKIGSNSPLFDWNKLNDISRNIISKMTCGEINAAVKDYFKKCIAQKDAEKTETVQAAEAQAVLDSFDKVSAMLAIDRETKKPRKDITKFSEIYELYNYVLHPNVDLKKCGTWEQIQEKLSETEVKKLLQVYRAAYSDTDTKEEWFERIKKMCRELGFADNTKEYKQNPLAYKGGIGDVTQVLRLALTGRENTPDLYNILKILGSKTVSARLSVN